MKIKLRYKVISAILIITIGGYFILCADDQLTEDAKQLVKRANPIPDSDNMYFSYIACDVNESENPSETGQAWIEDANRIIAKKDWANTTDNYIGLNYPEEKKLKVDWLELEKREERTGLFSHYKQHSPLLTQVIEANKTAINRYHEIYEYPAYQKTMLRSVEAPIFMAYTQMMEMQQLEFISAVMQYEKGNYEQALMIIRDDMSRHRRALVKIDELIIDMIELRMIQNDIHFASELISNIPVEKIPGSSDALFQPFTQAEISLKSSILNEAKTYAVFIEDLKQKKILENSLLSWLFDDLVFKPNRSHNLLYEGYLKAIDDDYLEADKYVSMDPDSINIDPGNWDKWTNLLGAISGYAVNTHKFYLRMHNTDAMLAMLRLKADYLSHREVDETIDQFIKRHSGKYLNPYTDQDIKWDAENNTLYVELPETELKRSLYDTGLPEGETVSRLDPEGRDWRLSL